MSVLSVHPATKRATPRRQTLTPNFRIVFSLPLSINRSQGLLPFGRNPFPSKQIELLAGRHAFHSGCRCCRSGRYSARVGEWTYRGPLGLHCTCRRPWAGIFCMVRIVLRLVDRRIFATTGQGQSCRHQTEARQSYSSVHLHYLMAFHRLLCGRLTGSGLDATGFIDFAWPSVNTIGAWPEKLVLMAPLRTSALTSHFVLPFVPKGA